MSVALYALAGCLSPKDAAGEHEQIRQGLHGAHALEWVVNQVRKEGGNPIHEKEEGVVESEVVDADGHCEQKQKPGLS